MDPFSSAVDIAAAIRRKEVSSREMLEVFLDRVTRLDTDVNSVVTLDAERAAVVAAEADTAVARGAELGPLHGVPITIKDSWQTAGLRTTSGAPELATFVPDTDAAPVARLRAAGAVIYGKTNLPIYAGDFQTFNDVFGTTNNPFALDRTPGGSSGGSAAALACGFTPLELGSDIGGSIRLPAHMSGVMGHKPSYGIVPAQGQIPGPPGTLSQADLAVAGPMARSVDDLSVALDVMAGPDRWQAPAWRLELPPRRPDPVRVGAWLDDPRCPVEPPVRDALDHAAGLLGATPITPPFTLEKAAATFFALLQAALSGGVSLAGIEQMAAVADDTALGRTQRDAAMRHRQWLSLNERRLQMRLRWEELFAEWDVVLLPVMPCTAFPHDHRSPIAARTIRFSGEDRAYWDAATWMAPAGLCYLPATVVPVGRTDAGLPVGIQIVGPYLHDRTTLHVAGLLTAALGGCPRPPGF